jgi:hypothetical protein
MNGKVYKIEDKETGEVYIGSTIMYLSKRLATHRSNCRRYDAGEKISHCSSYDIIRRNNYDVEILHKLVCENKNELCQLEREAIGKYGDKCVNKMRRPAITYEEKLQSNLKYTQSEKGKNKKAESDRKYREANKEAIAVKKKAYNEANKEAIAVKKKAYNEANKETISAKKKAYYQAKKLDQ